MAIGRQKSEAFFCTVCSKNGARVRVKVKM